MEFMKGIDSPTLDRFEVIEEEIKETREWLSYLEFNQLQGGFLVEEFKKVQNVAWVWKNFLFGRVFSDEDAGQRFRQEFEERTGPALGQLICVLKDGKKLLKSCIVKDRWQDWLQKAMKRADSWAMFEGIVKELSWCMQVLYEEILDVLERGNVDVFMCQMHRWDVVLEDSLVRLGVEAEQDAKNLVERLDLLLLQEMDPATDDHNPSPQSLKRQQQDRYIATFLRNKLTEPNRPLLQDRESSSTGRRSGAGAEGSVHGAEEMQGSSQQEGRSAGRREMTRVRTLPPYFWVDEADLLNWKGPVSHGASGVVSWIEWLREPYAVKMISSDYKTFTTEAFILAHLKHPHILQLMSCSRNKSKDGFYLVMEKMKQDLRDLIKERCKTLSPPFSLHVAVDIMLQIARAMEYLHQKGVMHRDLKALNVLIQSSSVSKGNRDSRVRIKVADFGLSKIITDSSSTLTFVGTTRWRAPEVFQQESHKYKFSADVYSFAITSYEILTGLIPFRDLEDDEIYDRIHNGDRPPIPDKIPIYLSSCLQRWWAGTPSDRPTFPEIRRMLQHLQRVLLRVPTHQVEAFLGGKPEAHNFSIFSFFKQEDVEELISIMGHTWCADTAVGPDKISHHIFQAAAASCHQSHPDSHQQDLASSILPSTLTPEA